MTLTIINLYNNKDPVLNSTDLPDDPVLRNHYEIIRSHPDLSFCPRPLLRPTRVDLYGLFNRCEFTTKSRPTIAETFFRVKYGSFPMLHQFYVTLIDPIKEDLVPHLVNGELGSLELINWGHQGNGYLLLVAHDKARIASPWISLIKVPRLLRVGDHFELLRSSIQIRPTNDGYWTTNTGQIATDPWTAAQMAQKEALQ